MGSKTSLLDETVLLLNGKLSLLLGDIFHHLLLEKRDAQLLIRSAIRKDFWFNPRQILLSFRLFLERQQFPDFLLSPCQGSNIHSHPRCFSACVADAAVEAAGPLVQCSQPHISPYHSQEIDSKPEFREMARNHLQGKNPGLSFTLLRERGREGGERGEKKYPVVKWIGKKKFPLMLYLWFTFWPFHNHSLVCFVEETY